MTRTIAPLALAGSNRTALRRSIGPAVVSAVLLAATLAVQAQEASAPLPMGQASVDELIDMLQAGGSRTRAFRRGNRPDASTNLCRAATSSPRAANPRAADGKTAGGHTRNLVVEATVPEAARPPAYAGDDTPGVQLDIGFGDASDKLSSRETALLDNLAKALQTTDLAQARFAVAGHTDTRGKVELNLELSCARALAVVDHLARRGVRRDRMAAYGFGSSRPLPGLAAGAPQHRRVEIRMEK